MQNRGVGPPGRRGQRWSLFLLRTPWLSPPLGLSHPSWATGSGSSSCWFCPFFPLVHSVGHYLCHIMAAVINQGSASHTLMYLKLPGGGGVVIQNANFDPVGSDGAQESTFLLSSQVLLPLLHTSHRITRNQSAQSTSQAHLLW